MTRYVLSFALIWLLSFSPLSAEPAKVMIIRHGEKPDEGHCLSLKGWQRAAALVPFFLGATADECDPLPGFGTPVAIYAQKPTQGNKSLRPMQTVQGLARALQLDVKPFGHDDFKQMINEIQTTRAYEGKTVLICWEHHAIRDLARELGVQDAPDFPGRFDRVWVISWHNGKAKLRDLPQQLMQGDSRD